MPEAHSELNQTFRRNVFAKIAKDYLQYAYNNLPELNQALHFYQTPIQFKGTWDYLYIYILSGDFPPLLD